MFSTNMQCFFLDLCHQFGYDVAAKIYAKDAILLEPPAVPTNNPNIRNLNASQINKRRKQKQSSSRTQCTHTGSKIWHCQEHRTKGERKKNEEVKTDCIIYFGTSHWNFHSFRSMRLHVSLMQIEVIDSFGRLFTN